jgi:hypothetical protein
MTKNKIVLISLAVALVALVVVYFLVVAPLLNDEVEPPVPVDGEGIFNNRLTVYAPIETENILSIHIKNDKSEHEFVRKKNEKNEVTTVIKGYEKLSFDESIYTYLLSFATAPLSADNEPYRNLTDEQMKEYGVTADTCQSTMTVYYKDANDQPVGWDMSKIVLGNYDSATKEFDGTVYIKKDDANIETPVYVESKVTLTHNLHNSTKTACESVGFVTVTFKPAK